MSDFTLRYVFFYLFQEKQKEKNYFAILWTKEIYDEKIEVPNTKVDYFHR